jgi:hypothetical protein
MRWDSLDDEPCHQGTQEGEIRHLIACQNAALHDYFGKISIQAGYQAVS